MLPNRMPPSAAVKNTVRASLNSKWIGGAFAALLPVLCYYIFSLLASGLSPIAGKFGIYVVYAGLIICIITIVLPLFYGTLKYFWRITDGKDADLLTVFYYFGSLKSYKRVLKFNITLAFYAVATLLICMLPYIVIQILSHVWLYDIFNTAAPVWAVNLSVLSGLFEFLGVLLASVGMLRFYLAPIFLIMDEDLLIFETMHLSSTVSKKYIGSYLSLICSNIGWIFLTLFVLPMIYTLPLLVGCYVVHSRYAVVNYNLNLEFYEQNRFDSYFKV